MSLDRLERSLGTVGFTGSFRSWSPGSFPVGCPWRKSPRSSRSASPRHTPQGAGAALWLDSSCVAIRSLDPIFEAIEENGYVLFRNGSYRLGEWASDHTLSEYGLPRDPGSGAPRGMPHDRADVWALGCGFRPRVGGRKVRDETAFRGIPEPLRNWDDYEDVKWNRAGCVSADPRVHGHRHDQTVAGILADRLQMELTLEGLEDYLVLGADHELRPTTAIVIDRDQVLSPPDPSPSPGSGPAAGVE